MGTAQALGYYYAASSVLYLKVNIVSVLYLKVNTVSVLYLKVNTVSVLYLKVNRPSSVPNSEHMKAPSSEHPS